MQREFWAEFNLYGKLKENEWQNKDILDGLVGKTSEGLPEGWNILNEFSRLQILAATLASDKKVMWKDEKGKERQSNVKDYARTGALQYKEKSGLLYWYYEGDYQNFLLDSLRKMSDILGLNNLHATIASPLPDLATLPLGSWAIQLTFTLRKPYISKDDTDFYILDNPVKKEHVFKVPYVAPSQWKGALRAAMRRLRGYTTWEEEGRDEQMVRLFGNVKGEENEFRAGRLHFYPTFFDKIGLEVINPHSRDTGAGKNPIYFEAVPPGAKSVFTLLYVPLGAGPTDERTCTQDLAAVARGVQAMLTVYGFGAKTSSGYGVTKEHLEEGKLVLHASDTPSASPMEATEIVEPEEAFYKYLDDSGEVKPEFKGQGEGGLMSNKEYREKGEALGGGTLSEFKAFRAWYSEHGEAWRASQDRREERSSKTSAVFQRAVGTLDELVEMTRWLQDHVAVSCEE